MCIVESVLTLIKTSFKILHLPGLFPLLAVSESSDPYAGAMGVDLAMCIFVYLMKQETQVPT